MSTTFYDTNLPPHLRALKEEIEGYARGYGQVESPYGSGEFYEYIHEMLGERDNVVCSRIPDRDAILGSIKEFLGTGR